MTKKYTLELTADELKNHEAVRGIGCATVVLKLHELAKQAKADRDADDLRLPWKAEAVVRFDNSGNTLGYTERAAKLMAAAPELHAAVYAASAFAKRWDLSLIGERRHTARDDWHVNVQAKIELALRKVETGVPE